MEHNTEAFEIIIDYMFESGKSLNQINDYTLDIIKKSIIKLNYAQCTYIYFANWIHISNWNLEDYFMLHCLSFIELDTKTIKCNYEFDLVTLMYYQKRVIFCLDNL